MNKKILLMLAGLLLLVIIGVSAVIYNNNKKQKASQTPVVTSDTSANDANPSVPTDSGTITKLKKLSDSPAVAPILSYDNQAVWFFTADGHLYKVNVSSGLKQEFLLPSKLSIADGRWPRTGNNFIVVSGVGSQKSFYYYDSDAKTSGSANFITFPSGIKDVDFLPDGKQVAYIWADSNGASLQYGTPDMKTYQTIAALPEKDLTLAVSPKGDRALLYNSDDSGNGKLYLVLFKDKKVITLNTSTENTAVWMNDGRYFVYNRDDGSGTKNTKLWIGDSESSNDREIGVLSSVAKVTSDKAGAMIYVSAKDGSSESIWRIDATSLVKTKSFDSKDAGDIQLNISEPFVSGDGATVYFKNGDGYIYSAPLK